MGRIAVIGAGIAAAALAARLKAKANLTVFEKSRGAGGRMASRRADPFVFDHGAQYFTIRTKAFRRFLEPSFENGTIVEWKARFASIDGSGGISPFDRPEPAWIGTPSMNSIAKSSLANQEIQVRKQVSQILGEPGSWQLGFEDGSSSQPFDWIVSTAPAPQTANLFPQTFVKSERIAATKMAPCFTAMLGLSETPDLPFDAAQVSHPILSWIAANHTKPGRPQAPSMVIHSNRGWAHRNIERDREELLAEMEGALRALLPGGLPKASHKAIHRWRYADIAEPAGEPFIIDRNLQLAACGDWCIGGRVESAFTSGHELGEELASLLG